MPLTSSCSLFRSQCHLCASHSGRRTIITTATPSSIFSSHPTTITATTSQTGGRGTTSPAVCSTIRRQFSLITHSDSRPLSRTQHQPPFPTRSANYLTSRCCRYDSTHTNPLGRIGGQNRYFSSHSNEADGGRIPKSRTGGEDRDESTSSNSVASPVYNLFPQTLPAGPPPGGKFEIDLRTLRREFLQLQSQSHPDFYHQTGSRREAEDLSALINDAYTTLCNPLLRAQHLLSLHGRTAHTEEGAQMNDKALLMDVLEIQEQIEEARSHQEVDELKVENDGRMKESAGRLGGCFDSGDLDSAQLEAVRLKFWDSINRTLMEWQPGKPVMLIH